jgi:hypothetical protein
MAIGKEKKVRLSADLRLWLRPVLRDVDLTLVSEENGYLGGEYGVKAIPHMIIIGRDGRIAAVHDGYGEREFPRLVKEILRV